MPTRTPPPGTQLVAGAGLARPAFWPSPAGEGREWRYGSNAGSAHLAPHLTIPPLPRATAQALAAPRQPGIPADVVQQMLEALRSFDLLLTTQCPAGPDSALARAQDIGPQTLATWRAARAAIAVGEAAL
ncbi:MULTISPECIES: hypothetical protein [Roseomonadaceae]|uniref:Uncharacterized protein n=1 Tax=Falsiroseomonas oleicola TaxID=2801474 RepID=A0ABS6H5P2_9PROT|nr:hypothetical protein [Roseomonas oleicola]MBU8543975.1 hypothetical protein [Roseomonas oleicola]